MITAPLTEEEQARAEVVSKILGSLQEGNAPSNWLDQLLLANVGSVGEQWEFARCLGAKGCYIAWREKTIVLKGYFNYLEGREGLNQIPHKTTVYTFPFNRKKVDQASVGVIDCLETTAKIAYVQGFDKAVKACVEAMSNQPSSPKPTSGWHYTPHTTG